MNVHSEYVSDVLIIGSGAAGLSLTLRLASSGFKVIVLSKELIQECSTFYAQGGIAAVFDETDSISSHISDTLISGAGLCDLQSVKFIVSNARHCIEWLIDQGVVFDTEITDVGKMRYHLTREGGHSHRRILHSADATGKEVQNTLISKTTSHPNICIKERRNAVDLIISSKIGLPGTKRVVGAYVWNRELKKVETFRTKVLVLATGGAAKVYQYTTNPDISSGDGIAMAWRAGCRVANLEFNQFHPTCLFHPTSDRNFLLTEALRGEGAYLKRPDGSRFMFDFDSRAELAPRDIVTRAIDHEMNRLGADCMYLDISHKPTDFIIKHFPTIYKKLLSLDINITTDTIPIVPAAHYTCGGVIVDQNGRTDLDGLYAIGEVSYTGLHGANRMASNSLLECLVYGWSAAKDILTRLPRENLSDKFPKWNENSVENSDERVMIKNKMIKNNWHELRLFMWNYVGIERSTTSLDLALRRINILQKEVNEYYDNFRLSNNLLELRNLAQVASLIIHCAIERKESRGLHYTIDYPNQINSPKPTILTPLNL